MSYELRLASSIETTSYELFLLELQVTIYELNFENGSSVRVTRKGGELSRRCKLNNLKYCCPQIDAM